MAKTHTGNEVPKWVTERGIIMNADESLLLVLKSNMKTLDDIFVNIKPHNKPDGMNKEILDHLYPNRKASGVTLLVDSITDFSDDAEWVECEITTYKTGASNE